MNTEAETYFNYTQVRIKSPKFNSHLYNQMIYADFELRFWVWIVSIEVVFIDIFMDFSGNYIIVVLWNRLSN